MTIDFEKYYSDIFKIANRQIFAGDKVTIDNIFKIGFGYDWDFSPSLFKTGRLSLIFPIILIVFYIIGSVFRADFFIFSHVWSHHSAR